jgi:PiT family inorganic phosphate transporter
LIGAIKGVTSVEGTNGINKKTIQKIIMSWVITLPASAILAIACYTPVSVLFGGSSDQVSFQNTTTIR